MDETVLAYAAGIIDGEGCISIKHGHTGRDGGGSFALDLVVVNSDPRLLLFMRDHFGGDIIQRASAEDGVRKKAIFVWTIRSTHAVTVLKLVYPYIIGKRDQIDIAVECVESINFERRFFLFEECKRLKHIDYGSKG